MTERVATLVSMPYEVGVLCHGRPSYRWKPGYIVHFEGKEYYPPVSLSEAKRFAKELGATKVEVK